MKPIIIDMDDMSDSREVYESRPNPFFSILIYLILFFFVVAFIWASVSEIDIPIKATGAIQSLNQIGPVTNNVAGEVASVLFIDGQEVKKGDLLYTIESLSDGDDRDMLKEKLEKEEKNLELLKLYKESVKEGKNLINEKSDEFSIRFENYLRTKNLNALDSDNTNIQLTNQYKELKTQLSNLEKEYNAILTLRKSISGNKSLFGNYEDERIYNNRFNEYYSIYKEKASSNTTNDTSNSEAKEKLEGYTLLLDSLNAENSVFIDDKYNMYEEVYDTFVEQVSIREASGDSKETIESYKESVKNKTKKEINAAKTAIQSATTVASEATKFKNTTLANLDKEINTAKLNVNEVRGQVNKLSTSLNQISENIDTENNNPTYTNSELNDINEEIARSENSILELKTSLNKVDRQLDAYNIKATSDGKIDIIQNIEEGTYLDAGSNVIRIVPTKESDLVARVLVPEYNITKLKEGMEVVYNVVGFPRNDFGAIKGKVSKISEEVQTDDNGMSSGVLVEATIDNRDYFDSEGAKGNLKVGMNFEAGIIVEKKRVLTYLLEELGLQ